MLETPVFMRLRSTLQFKTMGPWGRQSQSKNAGFPQVSSVFVGEMPIFAHIWHIQALKPASGAGFERFD